MCTPQFPVEQIDRIGHRDPVSTIPPFPASLHVRECMEESSCFLSTGFHEKAGEDVLLIMNRPNTLTCDFDRRVFRVVLCELDIREP